MPVYFYPVCIDAGKSEVLNKRSAGFSFTENVFQPGKQLLVQQLCQCKVRNFKQVNFAY